MSFNDPVSKLYFDTSEKKIHQSIPCHEDNYTGQPLILHTTLYILWQSMLLEGVGGMSIFKWIFRK